MLVARRLVAKKAKFTKGSTFHPYTLQCLSTGRLRWVEPSRRFHLDSTQVPPVNDSSDEPNKQKAVGDQGGTWVEPLERFHLPESLYLSAFETPWVECGTFSRFLSSAAQYRSSPACLSLIGLALIARASRAYFSRPTRILLVTCENSSDAPN